MSQSGHHRRQSRAQVVWFLRCRCGCRRRKQV